MRKLTLLFSFVVFAAFTFGQFPRVERKCNLNSDEITKINFTQSVKAAGDIYWEEDFDSVDWAASVSPYDINTYSGNVLISPSLMPAGWSVYDGNNEDYYWHWSQLGPRGRYTSYVAAQGLMSSLIPTTSSVRILQSDTKANGFMMLEADYFNTLPNGTMNPNYKAMDAYIMTPAIDLSDKTGVTLKFQQRFRWCCSGSNTLSLFVSNDYDPNNPDNAHWAEYSVKGGVSVNDFPTDNPFRMEIDITPDAAGYSNVRLMWRMIGASHYVWMIDDVQLVEPFTNNVVVSHTWADYMYMPPTGGGVAPDEDWFGGYTQIPYSLVGDFVQFRAAIKNFGIATQTGVSLNTKITRNGTQIYNQSSTPIANLAPAAKDTCRILTPFTPSELGQYVVHFNVTSAQTDEAPINNVDTFRFEVTEHTYSRVTHDPANYMTVSPGNWVGGDVEGARLAVLYDIPEGPNFTIKSLTTYIPMRNDSALIAAGQFMIIGRIFGLDADGNIIENPLASTEEYILTNDDRGNFLTLDFIDEGNLELAAGASYYAAFEFYTGTPAGTEHVDFYIAEDKTVPYPIYATNLFYDTDWGTIDANCFIDLNIDYELPKSTVTFNVNMTQAIADGIFNPATDHVDIAGTFNNNGSPVENLTAGENNVYTITKELFKNDAVTFKFRINGTTTETIVRNFTPSQDVETYNVWWNWIIGVNNANVEKVNIYPNPVSDVLNITNMNNISKVEISNVLGQVIYTNNDLNNTLRVDTKSMAKGVYFITITDVNKVTRTERFIKK